MLKITRETDYAMLIMCEIARHQVQSNHSPINATLLAQQTHISLSMVSKILKLLTKSALLSSTRGANGGYQLMKPIESLTAAHIICAIEGPFAINTCATDDLKCERSLQCDLAPHWVKINQTILDALSKVLLSDLIAPIHPVNSAHLKDANTYPIHYQTVLIKDIKKRN